MAGVTVDQLPRILANIRRMADASDAAALEFNQVLQEKFDELTDEDRWKPELGFRNPCDLIPNADPEPTKDIFGAWTFYHSADSFGEFPWSKLDPHGFSQRWSMSCGGKPFGEGVWSIWYVERFGIEHRWEMPSALSNAIGIIKQIAEQSTERKIKLDIRSALGIDD